MKKILFILLAAMFAFSVTSCKKDNAEGSIEITVKASGVAVPGKTVYSYPSAVWNTASFRTPFFAQSSCVTDETGVANFDLNTMDFGAMDQVTFYFAVFDNNDKIAGMTGVTIKKGEKKSGTINM